MTYAEFKQKWLGKGIDFDGSFGLQCVDVYRMYCKEVLGIPQSPAVVGAKEVWTTYLPEYFERIANTPDGVPIQGDIIIWGHGQYGHIGICDSADKQYLVSFEQNWELTGKKPAELRKHTYTNVLGWLQLKNDALKECLRMLHEVVIPEKEGLQRKLDELNQKLIDETKSRDDKILDLEKKVKTAEVDRNQFEEELKKFKEEDYQRMQSLAQKLMPKRVDWPAVISEIEGLVTIEDQKDAVEKELFNAKEQIKGTEIRVKELERLLALHNEAGDDKKKQKGGSSWQKLLSWITRHSGKV